MATSSYDSIFALKTEQVVVPAGHTAAVFVTGNAAGCNRVFLNQISGGTLFILGDGTGSTMSAAALLNAGATLGGFHVPAGILQIPGAPNFYLSAPGATAVVSLMYGKAQ